MKTSARSVPAKASMAAPPGVAGCRADDGDTLAALGKNMIHQPRQKLHGNILEGEGGAVKKLQDELVRTGLNKGANRRMAERCIALVNDAAQGRRVYFIAYEGSEHAKGDLAIALAAHGADVVIGELRPRAGNVKTAIAGKPCQHRIGKPKRRRIATRADIICRHSSYCLMNCEGGQPAPARARRIPAARLV